MKHEGMLGETAALLFRAFFHDGSVPFVEIPAGRTPIRIYCPRGVPRLQRGTTIRLYHNETKDTWSMFPTHARSRHYIDVAQSMGTLDQQNTTATPIIIAGDETRTIVVYIANGDLVFANGDDKIIFRGGKSREINMEDFYIEKHERNCTR